MMEKTFKKRQQWVQQDEPPVQEILSIYPALKHSKVVCHRNFFCTLINLIVLCFLSYTQLKQKLCLLLKLDEQLNSLQDNWELWRDCIIQYAKIESTNRLKVTELLGQYESALPENEGMFRVLTMTTFI